MFGWQLLEAPRRELSAAIALVASTPGMNTGLCLCGSQLPSSSAQLTAGLLGNTGWVFFSCRVLWLLWHRTPGVYQRLRSMGYRDIRYSTKMLQGPFSRSCELYAFYFLAMRRGGGGGGGGRCPWEPLPEHSGNTTSPTMRLRSDACWDDIHTSTQG